MAFFNRTSSGMIYLHHKLDGERFKRSTGIKVDKDKWNTNTNLAVNSQVLWKGQSVNSQLKQLEANLFLAIQDLTLQGGGMNRLYELYNDRCVGKRAIKSTGAAFLPYFKEYYEMLKADQKSTFLSYQTTYRRLEAFFGTGSPTFNDINMDFYEKFQRWMEKTANLSKNTISGQWKNIKHIMRLSYGKKLHSNTDFLNFKRKEERSDNIALTAKEIIKIEDAEIPTSLEKVRDWFLVQCYSGVAYADIEKVNYSNISEGIISYTREKSDENCIVPVHPRVKEILKKYNGYLPKLISVQKYDKYLKELCSIAQLTDPSNKRITKGGKKVKSTKMRWERASSHTGRRTFATALVLESIPIHLIMLMGGWKTLDSFDKYIKLREIQGRMELSKISFFKTELEIISKNSVISIKIPRIPQTKEGVKQKSEAKNEVFE